MEVERNRDDEPRDLEISAEQLLEEASKGGSEITKNDLRALKRYHWVPAPRQAGLGQARGSVTLYPPESVAQARAAMELRKRFRRVDEVTWGLWWQGFPVPEDVVRDFVATVAAEFDQEIERLRSLLMDADEFADLLDETAETRIRDPLMASVRKRTGRLAFPTVVRVVAEVVTGEFSGLTPNHQMTRGDDESVIDKAFGFVEARRQRILDERPWFSLTNDEVLKDLSKIVSSSPFEVQAATTTMADLVAARDEFNEFAEVLGAAARLMTWIWGKRGLGFGVVDDFIAAAQPGQQVIILLMWQRLMSDPAVRGNVRDLVGVKRDIQQARNLVEEFLGRMSPPKLVNLLSPKSLRRALRTKMSLETFERELRETVKG